MADASPCICASLPDHVADFFAESRVLEQEFHDLIKGVPHMVRVGWRVTILGAVIILAQLCLPVLHSSVWGAGSLKMGVVDPQAVLERSKAGKRALASLKEYAGARQKILTSDENELKRLEQELKDQNASLSQEELREKQERFRQKVQAYQKRVQEFNQELGARQKELVGEYMKKISDATKAIAVRRGMELVVDKGSENTIKIVIYNKQSIDLTNQVVREFDRKYK